MKKVDKRISIAVLQAMLDTPESTNPWVPTRYTDDQRNAIALAIKALKIAKAEGR